MRVSLLGIELEYTNELFYLIQKIDKLYLIYKYIYDIETP